MIKNSLPLACLLIASLSLPSCATRDNPPVLLAEVAPGQEPAQPANPPPAVNALYWRLAGYAEAYEEGVELIVAGDEVFGEERIAAAAEGLLLDLDECSQIEGCDIRLYVDVFERLLNGMGLALKRQAVRVTELETSAREEDLEREPGTTSFMSVMPQLGPSASLLKGTDLREMITLNGPVNAAIDDWLTWMRPILMEAYENYRFLRPKMAPVYEEAGLPEALLFAMLATESGGKVHSYSRAGAAGPLQFMRSTGRRYGLGVEDGFDMRLDPVAATRANVAFLHDQLKILDDNLELALAAYNGGETRVRNLYRKYGGSLWDPKMYYSLPRETREYVPRILAAAWLFLHPEDYHLEFPPLEAETALLVLRQEIAIGELTICLGQEQNPEGWFRVLRNLNPRMSPGDRVAAGESMEIPEFLIPVYEERCLEGEHLERAKRLHDANYPPEPPVIRYTVRRGDTLGKIASRHRCASIRELAAINNIRAPRYVIGLGQVLKVPTCP